MAAAKEETSSPGGKGVSDLDIKQAAQSNIPVDRRGGSKSFALYRQRKKQAADKE